MQDKGLRGNLKTMDEILSWNKPYKYYITPPNPHPHNTKRENKKKREGEISEKTKQMETSAI